MAKIVIVDYPENQKHMLWCDGVALHVTTAQLNELSNQDILVEIRAAQAAYQLNVGQPPAELLRYPTQFEVPDPSQPVFQEPETGVDWASITLTPLQQRASDAMELVETYTWAGFTRAEAMQLLIAVTREEIRSFFTDLDTDDED